MVANSSRLRRIALVAMAALLQRAGFAGGVEADNTIDLREIQVGPTTDYDECLSCQ